MKQKRTKSQAFRSGRICTPCGACSVTEGWDYITPTSAFLCPGSAFMASFLTAIRPGFTTPRQRHIVGTRLPALDTTVYRHGGQRQIHKYKDKSNSNTTNNKHFKDQLDQLNAKRGAKVVDFHLNSTLSQILSVGLSLPLPLSLRIKEVIASFCVFLLHMKSFLCA